MKPQYILVVGGPDTGKTHYCIQLMLRLEAQGSAARYFEPPANIEPLKEARSRLAGGRSADHTVGKTTREIVLPIEFPGGHRARIVWPEYAGEQLNQLVSRRHAGSAWAERAKGADAWLLFVRHEHIMEARDLLNRPISTWTESRKEPTVGTGWMPQARLIEVLQMLLFLRRASRRSPIRSPRLVVVLSCWDTFPDQNTFKRPEDALRTLAPLVADFIEMNWHSAARFVIALSALGKSLDKVKRDEDFMDKGPATQGWVIRPDGEKTPDLTWPLVHLTHTP